MIFFKIKVFLVSCIAQGGLLLGANKSVLLLGVETVVFLGVKEGVLFLGAKESILILLCVKDNGLLSFFLLARRVPLSLELMSLLSSLDWRGEV